MALELAIAVVAIVAVGALVHLIGQSIQAPENAWLRLLFIFLALLTTIIVVFGTGFMVEEFTAPTNVTTSVNTTQTWFNSAFNETLYSCDAGAYIASNSSCDTTGANKTTQFITGYKPEVASTSTVTLETTPASPSAAGIKTLLNVLGLVLLMGLFITLGFFMVRLTELGVEYLKEKGDEASKKRFK